jgi:hypothetical protein
MMQILTLLPKVRRHTWIGDLMTRYLVTMTADKFHDAAYFARWLDRQELVEPGLHGRNLFYNKTRKSLRKGDVLIWMYKHSHKPDIYLVGYAAVKSSVLGLIYGRKRPDGKRRVYNSVFAIDPRSKVVKKVRLDSRQFADVFRNSLFRQMSEKNLSFEQVAQQGAYIPEKDWKKVKALLR